MAITLLSLVTKVVYLSLVTRRSTMITGMLSCWARSRIGLATSVVAAPMIRPCEPLASRSSRSATCLAGELLASVISSSTFGYMSGTGLDRLAQGSAPGVGLRRVAEPDDPLLAGEFRTRFDVEGPGVERGEVGLRGGCRPAAPSRRSGGEGSPSGPDQLKDVAALHPPTRRVEVVLYHGVLRYVSSVLAPRCPSGDVSRIPRLWLPSFLLWLIQDAASRITPPAACRG